MTLKLLTAGAFAVLALSPLAAMADDDSPEEMALEARHGYMLMLGANMAPLAAMAKGAPYDEAAAVRAATNIELLSKYDIAMHFIPLTADGEMDDSDALPKIWDDPAGFQARIAGMAEAAAGAGEAVKGGADKVGPVVQKLGGACKACHDDYRAK